jgi:hypothetical protein
MGSECARPAAKRCETVDRTVSLEVTMTPDQLPLDYGAGYETAEDWETFRALLTGAIDAMGRKAVAYDLGLNVADLSNALAGRDRHPVKAEWLTHVLRHAPKPNRAALAGFLAGLADHEARPVERLTPEEKVRRLETEIARRYSGPEMERFLSSAYGTGPNPGTRKGRKP